MFEQWSSNETIGSNPDTAVAVSFFTSSFRVHSPHLQLGKRFPALPEDEVEDCPRERLKAIGCGVFAASVMLLNLLVLSIVHDYVGRESIPDVVFRFVPEQVR